MWSRTGAHLFWPDLQATLVDTKLNGASLRNVNLKGAFLRGCDLTGCELTGADLSDADLHDVIGFDAQTVSESLQCPVETPDTTLPCDRPSLQQSFMVLRWERSTGRV